jgi:hypothetical protein
MAKTLPSGPQSVMIGSRQEFRESGLANAEITYGESNSNILKVIAL